MPINRPLLPCCGTAQAQKRFFLGPWTKCFRREQESLPLLILISGVGNKVFLYYLSVMIKMMNNTFVSIIGYAMLIKTCRVPQQSVATSKVFTFNSSYEINLIKF